MIVNLDSEPCHLTILNRQGYTLIKVKHLINNMKIPINALESYGMRPAN